MSISHEISNKDDKSLTLTGDKSLDKNKKRERKEIYQHENEKKFINMRNYSCNEGKIETQPFLEGEDNSNQIAMIMKKKKR